MEVAMNQTLKLFIMHFFVLYLAQVGMQLFVTLVDYAADKKYLNLSKTSRDFLTAADFFIVFLFQVEVGVQLLVQGLEKWLRSWWHKFDVVVLIISLLVVIIDCAQVSMIPCGRNMDTFDGSWDEEFELLRDLLRLVRIVLFMQQMKDLLEHPLEHFSVLAEDLHLQAEEVNDYI